MVRSRVYGILAGYADQNDHDTLRADPLFKLLAERSPDAAPLASQPTLSRFENHIDIPSLKRLRDLFIDQFLAAFDAPPRRVTLDLGAVDDPAHGHQQLTFWHGYYDQNQYLPLFITCPDNDLFVMLSLRPGNVHAALGADDDLEYLVHRLRRAWPDVVIEVRGDSAFGIPRIYEVCERLGLLYTFGLTANPVLQRQTEVLLAQAVAAYAQERQAARGRAAAPGRAEPAVHRLLVSGGHLGPQPLCGRQGGGPCAGDQPAVRGDQPARGGAAAGADLRRLRGARRQREPQQGDQMRVGDGPA